MDDKDLKNSLINYFIKRYFNNQTPPPEEFLLDFEDLYFTSESEYFPLGQSELYDRAIVPEKASVKFSEPQFCNKAHSWDRAE